MPNKNSFYFPHDINALKDPKCSALIRDMGVAAYGAYWMIIEILHEQGGKLRKFPKLYSGLAFQMQISEEEATKLIEAMLHDYELLTENNEFIWSERVLRNLEEREAKRQAKVEAGRLGGIQSGLVRTKQNRSKTKHTLKQNEANEAKERKGKEIYIKENNKRKSKHLPKRDEVQETEMQRIGEEMSLSLEVVRDTWEDVLGYTHSNGKEYADYPAVLRNWLRRALRDGKISKEVKEDEYAAQLNAASR